MRDLNRNDKIGLMAAVLVIVSLVVGVFALLKVISALLPMLGIGVIVGGLLYWRNKT